MRSETLTKLVGTGAVGLLALVATGCGAATEDSREGASVVTGTYALEWLAERVGGNKATVHNLTDPGADPHETELTPRQVGRISEADIALYVERMQPAFDDAVTEQAPGSALNVADTVELRNATEGGHDHEGEGAPDPHVWLDTDRFSVVAETLGERLADVDPDNAAVYRDNATSVTAELAAIDEEYEAGLADCASRTFIVSHTAFGYIAERYDLEQIGVSGVDAAGDPSPARMAEVTELVQEAKTDTVFTEPLADERVATTIAEETGARVEVLDPLEGVTEDSPGENYPAIMRANLESLRTALDCA